MGGRGISRGQGTPIHRASGLTGLAAGRASPPREVWGVLGLRKDSSFHPCRGALGRDQKSPRGGALRLFFVLLFLNALPGHGVHQLKREVGELLSDGGFVALSNLGQRTYKSLHWQKNTKMIMSI